jgi:hypothetical protein
MEWLLEWHTWKLIVNLNKKSKMLQELNSNELIFINGGDAKVPSPGQLGYAVGHAIGQTINEFGLIAGAIMVFFP